MHFVFSFYLSSSTVTWVFSFLNWKLIVQYCAEKWRGFFHNNTHLCFDCFKRYKENTWTYKKFMSISDSDYTQILTTICTFIKAPFFNKDKIFFRFTNRKSTLMHFMKYFYYYLLLRSGLLRNTLLWRSTKITKHW